MNHIELSKDGNVFVITLIDSENKNTFTSSALDEYNRVFDEIEESKGNASLVVKSSDPKFFSNGINLQWIAGVSDAERDDFLYRVKKTLLRSCLLNLPTIGCINGHAYAMGAILASSMDFRIMRSDRGKLCFPEVTYGMPLDEALLTIIGNLPSRAAVQDMVLAGTACTGEECFHRHIVNEIHPEDVLLERTMEFARDMAGKSRENYALIKNNLKKPLREFYEAW